MTNSVKCFGKIQSKDMKYRFSLSMLRTVYNRAIIAAVVEPVAYWSVKHSPGGGCMIAGCDGARQVAQACEIALASR